MQTLLTFIIVLGLLVFVHELGHFVMARILGVRVKEFGFGFPPRLWGTRRGETVYSINWIPLGGFVRLHGEDGEEHDAGSFVAQRAWKRFLILIAGVSMNVLLAAAVFTVGFAVGLPTDMSAGTPSGGRVRDIQVQIIEVAEGSAAAGIHLQPGDGLLTLNGQDVTSVEDAQRIARDAGVSNVDLTYRRSGRVEQGRVTLATIPNTNVTGLGVSLVKVGTVSYPLYRAAWEGIAAAGVGFWAIVQAFGQLIGNLAQTGSVGGDVAGPVGIAVLTGQVSRLGFAYLLQFVALLSLNLAIINILPIPALDGGRVLFLAIEKLRGKPVSRSVEARIHNTGFAILIALVTLITFRDVIKLTAFQTLWNRLF
jgi:regulator of sigma E protease